MSGGDPFRTGDQQVVDGSFPGGVDDRVASGLADVFECCSGGCDCGFVLFLSGDRGVIGKWYFVPLGHDVEVFHCPGAFEDSGQCVVIGGRDGVELVVVASSTANSQSEERPADGVDLFVDDVHLHFARIVFGEHLGSDYQEAGGDDAFESCLGRGIVGEQIAGELFADELVVGQVRVEGIDDVVSVSKRIGVAEVFVETIRVGIACDIEPVSGPALSIGGAGEQSVDESSSGGRRMVGEEVVDFFGGGWESCEVERDSAEPGSGRRGGSGLEFGVFESSEDEAIDGVGDPVFGLDVRLCGHVEWLEGPEPFLGRGEE